MSAFKIIDIEQNKTDAPQGTPVLFPAENLDLLLVAGFVVSKHYKRNVLRTTKL